MLTRIKGKLNRFITRFLVTFLVIILSFNSFSSPAHAFLTSIDSCKLKSSCLKQIADAINSGQKTIRSVDGLRRLFEATQQLKDKVRDSAVTNYCASNPSDPECATSTTPFVPNPAEAGITRTYNVTVAATVSGWCPTWAPKCQDYPGGSQYQETSSVTTTQEQALAPSVGGANNAYVYLSGRTVISPFGLSGSTRFPSWTNPLIVSISCSSNCFGYNAPTDGGTAGPDRTSWPAIQTSSGTLVGDWASSDVFDNAPGDWIDSTPSGDPSQPTITINEPGIVDNGDGEPYLAPGPHEVDNPAYDPFDPNADPDLDGIPNHSDPDDDNDGIPDVNSPNHPEYDPTHPNSDPDNDGLPNVSDPDDDNDGLPDVNSPTHPEFDPNHPDSDPDLDGVPNINDPDDNDDGIPDVNSPNHPEYDPNHPDSDPDNDGIPNRSDPDDDNDGIPDGSSTPNPTPEPTPEPDSNPEPGPDCQTFGICPEDSPPIPNAEPLEPAEFSRPNWFSYAQSKLSDRFPFDIFGSTSVSGNINDCPIYTFFDRDFELCPIRDLIVAFKWPAVLAFAYKAFWDL